MLKGKILKILSSYSVVISLGKEQGVTKDMKFIIYEEGDMIKDPETGADIEKLEILKGEVTVTQVQEKISVAESFAIEKRVYNPLDVVYAYTSRTVITKEKKPLTDEAIEAPAPSKVKIGDLVRQIS
ncbi:MAG: hypothetical protein ABSD73_01380 [Candidatus Bathyarchaeia archaeon]